MEVKSPDQVDYLNAMIYGPAGVGKTMLMSTAQDHSFTKPLILIDCEGGTTTLRNRPDIDVVRINSLEDLIQVQRTLKLENNGYYKSCAIDSLTELQKLDMSQIMKEVVAARPDMNEDVPSPREWGITLNHMRRIVRAFRDLEMNTFFSALVDVDQDDVGRQGFYPSLQPKRLRTEVPGFLDIVGYMTTFVEDDVTHRQIQFEKTQKVIAKDRTQALGQTLTDTTIPQMFDLVFPKTKSK